MFSRRPQLLTASTQDWPLDEDCVDARQWMTRVPSEARLPLDPLSIRASRQGHPGNSVGTWISAYDMRIRRYASRQTLNLQILPYKVHVPFA